MVTATLPSFAENLVLKSRTRTKMTEVKKMMHGAFMPLPETPFIHSVLCTQRPGGQTRLPLCHDIWTVTSLAAGRHQ